MSTILKALRRLEREKTQKGRPLREQVTSGEGAYRGDVREPRRWPILLSGIGAGVLAGLAVLFLVFARSRSPEEGVPAAPAPAAPTRVAEAAAPPEESREALARATAAAERRLARERAAESARAPAPAPEPLEEVAVLDRGAPGPRRVEAEPAPDSDAAAPKPGSLRPMQRPDPRALPGSHLLPEAAGSSAGPTRVGASGPAPAVAPPPEAVAPAGPNPRVAQPPTPTPRAERPPAPRAEPLEAAVAGPERQAGTAPAPRASAPAPEAAPPKRAPAKAVKPAPAPLPELRVARTTWHSQAERRTAVIELPDGETQSVHEGDRVAGALVKRIEPSGVVFEQAGREFRRKLGERGGRS